MRKRIADMLIPGLGVGLALLVGCNDPMAKIQTQHRLDRIQMWLDDFETREVDGVRRLRNTVDLLAHVYGGNLDRARYMAIEMTY